MIVLKTAHFSFVVPLGFIHLCYCCENVDTTPLSARVIPDILISPTLTSNISAQGAPNLNLTKVCDHWPPHWLTNTGS